MSINKNSQKAPNLRFKGFTDDWEQRELKNLVTRIKSYSLSRSVETNSDTNTKYIHYGDIHTHVADKIGTDTTLPYIVPGVYETLNKGDLVLADASEDYQGIATPAIVMVQTDYSLVAGLHTIALRPVKIDSLYLYYLIKSPIFRKYGYKVGTGMKVFGISVNRLLDFKTLMPVTLEQSKISKLLLLVDNTITLHQRKLDQLNQLKEALLQQMFPGKGETVPKLRFAGFEGDWEERKLGDLLNKNTEKNKDLSVINVESVSNKTGFTKQTEQFGDYSVASADLSNYYVIRERQFAYNPSRINVGSIAYKALGDDTAVVSPLYVSFSTKSRLHDGFIWNWFKTPLFDAQRQRLAEGGVRDTLSFTQLSEMDIISPDYLEQEKISDVFKQLDNTITLQQRKLEQLKDMKQVLLQNMFI